MRWWQRKPIFMLVAVLAVIAAIWLSLWLAGPRSRTLDERVHAVAVQLKCPVCQGESVADSPSQISKQIREIIRQKLQAGQSEQEVIQYFVSRYGEQIVWVPQWQGITLLAWLVPILLLFGGGALLCFVLRDWRTAAISARLTEEDQDVARELDDVDEESMKRYRSLLEREMAADDVLFEQRGADVVKRVPQILSEPQKEVG
jgi:cytochrome c-type biogenesis protein CcmH